MLSDSHRQALWTVLAAEFETGGKLHEREWVFLPGIRVFDSVQVRVLMLTNEHLRLSLRICTGKPVQSRQIYFHSVAMAYNVRWSGFLSRVVEEG